jgi:hypothetical protein
MSPWLTKEHENKPYPSFPQSVERESIAFSQELSSSSSLSLQVVSREPARITALKVFSGQWLLG